MKTLMKVIISTLLFFSPLFAMELSTDSKRIYLNAEDMKLVTHSLVLKKYFDSELQKNLVSEHELALPDFTTAEDFKLLMAHLRCIENFKQGILSKAAFDSYLQHASIRDLGRTIALADFWEVPELLEREQFLLDKLTARCTNKNFFYEYFSEKQEIPYPMQMFLAKKLSAKHISMLSYWFIKQNLELHENRLPNIIQCKKHSNPVESLAVSADGSLLASGSSSHTGINIWDTHSGKCIKTFENRDWSQTTKTTKLVFFHGEEIGGGTETIYYPEKVIRLAFVDNSKLFAVSVATNMSRKHTLWPILGTISGSPSHLQAYINNYTTDNHIVADIYSPNQPLSQKTKWLLKQKDQQNRCDKLLLIPEPSRNQLIIRHPNIETNIIASHNLDSTCQNALFDKEASQVAYIDDNNTLQIWTPNNNIVKTIGQGLSPIKHWYDIPGFAWNSNKCHILTVHTDLKARLWNSKDASYQEFPNTKAAFFSPNGVLFITICADQNETSINIWEVENNKLILSIKNETEISNATCMPDSTSIVCSDIKGIIKIIPFFNTIKAQETINELCFDDMLLLLFGHNTNKEPHRLLLNNETFSKTMTALPDGIRQTYMKAMFCSVNKEPKPLPN